MTDRVVLFEKVRNFYLLTLFILSPAYLSSMSAADGTGVLGLLSDVFTLPPFVWPVILLLGVGLIFSLQRPVKIYLWLGLFIVLWSVFLSWAKFHAEVWDQDYALGIVWIIVVLFAATLPLSLVGKTIYFGLMYLSVVNFILSLNQLSVGYISFSLDSLLLITPNGDHYSLTRAVGIFNTPLALGCFGIFAFFSLISMRNFGFRYHGLGVTIAALLPVLAISKSAILIMFSLLVSSLLIKSLKKSNMLSAGVILSITTVVLFIAITAGIYVGVQSDTFSASYKPAAIASFVVTVMENPDVLIFGITDSSLLDFEKNLASSGFTENASFESWMLRLIAFYGLPFFVWFIFMGFIATKLTIPPLNRWYIGCAFGGLILTALVSNGGAQPPTSFLIFAVVGMILNQNRGYKDDNF